ncbi:hypothetical protein F4860DRAFT_475620 [Xylaria cubensis]|nr:hypothetical protein F4860DRAFT_475620 [Xylaria cubensis]
MDNWEKDLAACEQDVVMTDSWWPSTPPLLSVPIMSSNEGLGYWDSPSTVDPFFFGDVGTARNVPRDFVQSPTGDIGIPTPDFEAIFHHSDADIDLAFDWVDFDIPLHSVDGIVEPRSFIDNNMLSPASGALRSPGNPTTRIRRTALNQRQKGILADWVARNSKPYPSKEDKANLATATGLSVKQISGWFARTRQRALPRVQSHATVATQSGISSSVTREKCTKNQSIGLLGDLESYGRPNLAGAVLGLHWSRCTSLPPQPKRSFARTFPKRARSLPHIFTLDLIHPCTSNLSQLSQGRLSLDVAAPTHKSESNKLDCGAQPLTRRVVQDPIYPLKPISNLNFIEAWIQDVARYVAPIDDPLEIKRFSPSVESYDINNSQNTEETPQTPTVFSQEEQTAGLQMSTADNQVPLQAIQDTKHIARQRRSIACRYCRRRKIRCSGYSDSPEKRCKNCIKMKLECVFEPISVTKSTAFIPLSSLGNGALQSDQGDAGYVLNAAPQSSQNKKAFDTMSSAGSSAGSVGSASSYMSFGPRKGRRVAFRKPSLGDSNPHTLSPGFATSFQTPKDHSPANDDGYQIVSETTEYHDHDKPFSENENNGPVPTRHYWCTFCHQSFSRYFTWKRHEESAHVPQFTWICRPDIFCIKRTGSECSLCVSSSSNMEYTSQRPCPHRFQECWQKPDLERTFYRQDTFVQHLHSVHFKDDPIRSHIIHDHVNIDNCKQSFREMDADELICHFCGFDCRTWNERAQHIRKHFENGETMGLWIPGGPYALNRDGSTPSRSPAQRRQYNMSDRYDLWGCHLNTSMLETHPPGGLVEFACTLCGIEINCSCFCLQPGSPCRLKDHLLLNHHMQRLECSYYTTPAAGDYIEHLVKEHSAVRGNWMRDLVLLKIFATRR